MLFSSISFLYYFLPLVLLVYFLAPARARNAVLLVFSLVFYAWGEPKYVLLMALTIALGYAEGRLIARARGTPRARWFLALSVAADLGLLAYFKYFDFLIGNLNALTGLALPLRHIALPVGISFYTFQLLSYLVDVARGTPAQRSPWKLATYISLFPQLIAGPIVRYGDIAGALDGRKTTLGDAARGARRFVLGLSKKVLLANSLAALCAAFRASDEPSVLFYWLYAAAFSLQIYFDFSGYSDMAIGLGRIFGFSFPENFDHPFVSGSITEFWRRWHISLGSWFRDYVYIPLGGSRTTQGRRIRNILIVWLLTGLWHGAAWNFVLWGGLFALLLLVEKGGLLPRLQRARGWNHLYVLFFVTLSFVLFNADGLAGAAADIGALFGAGGLPLASAGFWYALRSYALVLALAAVGATPLPRALARCAAQSAAGRRVLAWAQPLCLGGLFVLCTAWLVDGSYNPFLYFRF